MKKQNAIALSKKEAHTERFVRWMKTKNSFFSLLLNCEMTNLMATGLLTSSILFSVSILFYNFGELGYALCCLLLAAQAATPGIKQFIKEGGRR